MPTWTKSPPDDPRGYGLPIVRTPATRSLRAIVTSHELMGCDTHFWGGHTVPCDRPDCDACSNAIAYRWHGYLSALNPADDLHFIFEVTAQAADKFATYMNEHGTLRCCQFEAWRWGHRKNGRVMLKLEHSATPEHALPKAPEIQKVMAVIWRLPIPQQPPVGIARGNLQINSGGNHNGQSSDPKLYLQPGA